MADGQPPPLIVIGASAGGVETLSHLVRELPEDLEAAVAVVLHIPPEGISVLADILGRAGPLPAVQAAAGDPLVAGHIYVAPPDRHLVVEDGLLGLSSGPRENGHRPAIDALFNSAARAAGPRTIGVILSGTLDDGAAGLGQIRLHSGMALVQDPEDALYRGMPEAALARVQPDLVGDVGELARALPNLARRIAGASVNGDPIELEPPEPGNELAAAPDMPENRSVGISCPECGGALWVVGDEGAERFRCRIGHAYSEHSLLVEHAHSLEAALWTALRALEERAALMRRMGRRARENGQERSAVRFEAQAGELERQGEVIRDHVLPRTVGGPELAEQA